MQDFNRGRPLNIFKNVKNAKFSVLFFQLLLILTLKDPFFGRHKEKSLKFTKFRAIVAQKLLGLQRLIWFHFNANIVYFKKVFLTFE